VRDSTRHELRTELGASLPFFLDDLEDDELLDLAAALAGARVRQAEALEAAIDKAMRFLPWGVRGTVRKVLIG
jgi:hypothetical protein